MKKYLFIAMLSYMLVALSTVAQNAFVSTPVVRQSSPINNRPPCQVDPAQQQLIRNAEAQRMKTYNGKGHGLKFTDFSRLDRKNAQDMQSLREQELLATAAGYRLRLTNELNKCQKLLEKSLDRINNLMLKQHKERARLEEKQAKEAAKGFTEDMRKRHEAELAKLDNKHARQLMDAQLEINKAKRNYDMIEYALENSRR